MIKILAVIGLVLLFEEYAGAQYFEVRGGVNLSSVLEKDYSGTFSSDYSYIPGFRAGMATGFHVTGPVYLEFSVIASGKGYSYSHSELLQGQTVEYREKLELWYLEIPAGIKIYLPPHQDVFFISGGPYFGMGLTGSHKTAEGQHDFLTRKIKWGSDPEQDDFNRTDFGLTAGAGLELGPFQLGMNYGFSLLSISPYSDFGYKYLNRGFGIFLGFRISTRPARNATKYPDQG